MARNAPVASPSVLVVDDEATVRLMVRDLLVREGYPVVVAADGKEAVAAVKSHECAVAVVDKNLPGNLNGLDILRETRKYAPFMRVIIFTGYPSQESAIEALRHGAFDYIEKPIDTDLIVEKVRRAWEAYLLTTDREELFRKYETLFEVVPGIVWFMTEEGVLTRINKEGAAMLGYTPADLLGRPYAQLLSPGEDADSAHWAFKERRTGARATRRKIVELRTRAGGARLFEVSSTGAYDRPQEDPNKRYWGTLGVGWDITEHALMEEQLQQARKLEAIGRMAGAVAHDFNNLLSVILNNAQFLKGELETSDPRHTDVSEVENAALRAADLTRQLLAFSRKQVVQPEPLNLFDVLGKLEGLLRRLVSENIEVEFTRDSDLSLVKADRSQVEQVVLNLAANARDAMPDGGRLTIQVSDVVLDEEFAAAHLNVSPGPFVMLAVSDTGHGMSPEVRAHLFEPFFTTKEPGRGTGLGMATVYGIVTQAGGHVSVYSEERVGTSVKVYLPVIAEAGVETREPATTELRQGSEQVLVVEDEAMVRRLARRILERHGYHVIEAANGQEALEQWGQRPIDLLVTDMVMPKMSGTELALRLREALPAIKVVYMSGYVGNVITQHKMLEDGSRFLQKPFTAATLLGAIREVLEASA